VFRKRGLQEPTKINHCQWWVTQGGGNVFHGVSDD